MYLCVFVAASAEIKRKNAEGVLEPTRAQNIGNKDYVQVFLSCIL